MVATIFLCIAFVLVVADYGSALQRILSGAPMYKSYKVECFMSKLAFMFVVGGLIAIIMGV
jgi:hypothetical protein